MSKPTHTPDIIHDRIGDKIDDAGAHYADNVFYSAARCLREVADMLDKAGDSEASKATKGEQP